MKTLRRSFPGCALGPISGTVPRPIRFSPSTLNRVDAAGKSRVLGRSSWIRYLEICMPDRARQELVADRHKFAGRDNKPSPMNLIKSKRRVADHGEVLTPGWLVEKMLDLVKGETGRIDSRFLEPACGSGNFLVPVLQRKLAAIEAKYGKSDFEKRH
jgi:hypothetical protein